MDEVAESRDESRGYHLDKKGIKSVGARTNQTGILRANAGCPNGLIEMVKGYRIRLNRVSSNYRAQHLIFK